MLSRNYEFDLVITSYGPCGLPYYGHMDFRTTVNVTLKQNKLYGKTRKGNSMN